MDEWTSMVWNVKNHMKKFINGMCDVAIQTGVNLSREQIENEFLSIALYVAGADNNISNDERRLINTLFDLNFDPSNISNLLKPLGEAYDDMIVQLQLPVWILTKGMDKALNSNEATDQYIFMVRSLMGLVAASDDVLHPGEEKLMEDFITRLERDRGHASSEPSASVNTSSIDPVEEIKKYKELLDQGILTQEEFDAKKKQLLGL